MQCVCWKSRGRQHKLIYQSLCRPLPLFDTHKHYCECTVKASCPEHAHRHILWACTHTHTVLMHSHPPSINKLHQMLSANSPCKRERALHHGSAVSSQGWQLHKKAWNNLPGFPFFFRLPYKTNCDKDTQGRKERNKENKFFFKQKLK